MATDTSGTAATPVFVQAGLVAVTGTGFLAFVGSDPPAIVLGAALIGRGLG